jgi:hypothetical protein
MFKTVEDLPGDLRYCYLQLYYEVQKDLDEHCGCPSLCPDPRIALSPELYTAAVQCRLSEFDDKCVYSVGAVADALEALNPCSYFLTEEN